MSNTALALPNSFDSRYEERIAHLQALELADQWRTNRRQLAAELALAWGVSPKAVKNMASEAWRRLKTEATRDGEGERIAALLVRDIEGVFRDSIAEAKSPVFVAGVKNVVAESPSVPRKTALDAARTLQSLIEQNTPMAQLGSAEFKAMHVSAKRDLLERVKARLVEVEAEVETEEAAEAARMGAGEP